MTTLVPKILYQDDSLLIVNKPYGLVVNKADSVKELTVADWVEKNFDFWKNGIGDFKNRFGIVHRIDKETSGLLIIAKTENSFVNLQQQFFAKIVKKKYYALVHGNIKEDHGGIEGNVVRNPINRRRFTVVLDDGKASITNYNVANRYRRKNESLTLVEVLPITGRTHQIRVHFKFINHPLVSDLIYGGRKTIREDLKWCPRLFLHSFYLSFLHPGTGKQIFFECELPNELKEVLLKLEKI